MSPRRPVRVAGFSGSMGDRFSAFHDAVHGEPVDVLVGDSMTEFVESVVAARFLDDPEENRRFFAPMFAAQLLPELPVLADKNLKVVTNAGVHNPQGLAEEIRQAVRAGGTDLRVATVTGDDVFEDVDRLVTEGQLVNTDTGESLGADGRRPLAADAYLGAWGVKAALDAGADIVITGRVADASLISGVAAWWHGWERDELDKIAGAVAAGHVIECGPQATGGNFSGFTTVPDNTVPGFPIAEIADNGDCVITKRAGEGGAVTVDTVTAQLLYEIQGPRYLNPDVTWHVDSVTVTREGPDRVRVTGAKGSAPVETTRVGVHLHTGYRGSMWYFPTGLQIEDKVALLRRQAEIAARENDVAELRLFACGRAVDDPADQWQATVPVKVTVAGATAAGVEGFLSQLNSFWLGSFPGFYMEVTDIFPDVQARVDYWPGLLRQDSLRHRAHLPDGRVVDIPHRPGHVPTEDSRSAPAHHRPTWRSSAPPPGVPSGTSCTCGPGTRRGTPTSASG
ncbi:acyclic terpene utilization AtuA family protein [Actinosynnema sp. NPDC053489]|uniref:acyclic terpene utilization AtuA family protein n=1 Tax=Actinosynnema sp. NPDC053489 TaxID=3363916 RepID=UPI0037C76A92